MSSKNFSLRCESFQKNVCNGLINLQQKGEFVDMTLAVDGYFVKVHQNLMALASPYIKQILQSMQCQHPVIFLTNISYEVLCYLLQYIYTGEVPLPFEILESFLTAARTLKVYGIENIVLPHSSGKADSRKHRHVRSTDTTNTKRKAKSDVIQLNTDDGFNMPMSVNNGINNYYVASNSAQDTGNYYAASNSAQDTGNYYAASNSAQDTGSRNTLQTSEYDNVHGFSNSLPVSSDSLNMEVDTHIYNDGKITIEVERDTEIPSNKNNESCVNSLDETDTTDQGLLNSSHVLKYAMSNKGGLQLILNRFIYYLHHQSNGGQKKRWRCIDYRKSHCQAYVDTINYIILNRKNMHNHPFHDQKIATKINLKQVFESPTEAEMEALSPRITENKDPLPI